MAGKVLRTVATAGLIVVAASSPLFVSRVWKGIFKEFKEGKRRERKRVYDAFTYLRKRGLIRVRYLGAQIHISLTPEGKKRAGKDDIDRLAIVPQRNWDGTWRLLLFDVPSAQRVKREALRGKLIELGFSMLQKSVWVHPYECAKEVALLKQFFGFDDHTLKVIPAPHLGGEEGKLMKYYDLTRSR